MSEDYFCVLGNKSAPIPISTCNWDPHIWALDMYDNVYAHSSPISSSYLWRATNKAKNIFSNKGLKIFLCLKICTRHRRQSCCDLPSHPYWRHLTARFERPQKIYSKATFRCQAMIYAIVVVNLSPVFSSLSLSVVCSCAAENKLIEWLRKKLSIF